MTGSLLICNTGRKSHCTRKSERKGRNMTIDGYTRTCGLIGNPVEHTVSPAIHNFLAERTGRDLAYVPFHVETGRLEDAVKGAFALNLLGVNVTVPYKSEVIPYLVEVDRLAARIGAVNTLVRLRDGFKGYNTDMPGLYRAMQSDGVRVEGEKALILGAGGAARAVAVMLADKGAGEIRILNRTLSKAEQIAEEVNAMTGKTLAAGFPLEAYKDFPKEDRYLGIQTTNVGMFPKVEDVLLDDPAFYDRIHTGYDLIFNPLDTRFMQLTRQAGGRAFNGLKMLLYQGIIAYELWTGCEIPETLAQETYQNMRACF